MWHGQTSRLRLTVRSTMVGAAFALWCLPAFAQTTGASTTASASTAAVTASNLTLGTSGLGSSNFTNVGSTPIAKTDPFYQYFAAPLSAGYSGNASLVSQNSFSASATGTPTSVVTGKGVFGASVYTATTKATTGSPVTTTNTNAGITTQSVQRKPAYSTNVDPSMLVKAQAPTQVQGNLVATLQQSPTLQGQNISLAVVGDNQVVVLRGVCASESDKKLAESLVRLTPGVRFVDNQITIATK